ncbi:MAG: AMP-binding protein [Deltaproteobacteria bacterium]|nr:AMP-binding protein [Deltaproteobacteria bacterium]
MLDRLHGARTALDDGQRALTFDELDRRSDDVAAGLAARGLQKGDRVAWVVRSSIDAVIVLIACLRSGLVVVPVNPGYQEQELAHVLEDCGASLIVVDGEPNAALLVAAGQRAIVTTATLVSCPGGDQDVDVDDDDLAMLIYTSGTTGRSKGCAHTAGGLARGIDALMELWAVDDDDVIVHALPLFHVHGLCVALLGGLLRGACTRLLPQFSAQNVVDAVAAGGTVFMCVPTMIHRLLAHLDAHVDDGAVLGRLRLVTCGSAALSADHLVAFRAKTGLTILERYGMSESLITLSNPLVGERKPGSVGAPVPGTTMKILDDELLVKAPGMMRGYWNRPDADREVFDDEGWFKTGDVVSVDDDGAVRIVGRASQDILKVGGYKLSTREIEEQLERHLAILEVAVVGEPDVEWGERVVAVVVLRSGCALTLQEAQDAVPLHNTKKPRRLVVVDALPRNALGKVMKPALKALIRDSAR